MLSRAEKRLLCTIRAVWLDITIAEAVFSMRMLARWKV